jgi:hypothetical protein
MKSPSAICVLLAVLALTIRPNAAGAAELELERGKITTAEYLRRLAFLGGPLPDVLRFDEYKIPPFPKRPATSPHAYQNLHAGVVTLFLICSSVSPPR